MIRRAAVLSLILLLPVVACGTADEPPPDAEDIPGELLPDTPAVVPPDQVAVDTVPPPPDPPVREPPVQDPEVAEEPPTLRTAEGVLGVTGTEVAPTAVIRVDDETSLGLTGDLAPELRRLAGARVRVEGRPAATPVGAGIEVLHYRILEIEGRVPEVGILREELDRWILYPEDGEPLILEGMPATGIADGMKIWVVGQPDADRHFRVESYGVIAPMTE